MDVQFIRELIDGVKQHRDGMHDKLIDELIAIEQHGQTPKALFIACSDSRFGLQSIMSWKPGVLFVHRNIGAIVPPYSSLSRSILFDSILEYAVEHLDVEHIIVCGHTSCGAVKELMHLDRLDSQSRLKEWLAYMEHVPGLVRGIESVDEKKMQDIAELLVVKTSLANLMTYDSVSQRVNDKKLSLVGWRYNLTEMSVEAYDAGSDKFMNETDYLKSLS